MNDRQYIEIVIYVLLGFFCWEYSRDSSVLYPNELQCKMFVRMVIQRTRFTPQTQNKEINDQ